jgi:hypothetical protein
MVRDAAWAATKWLMERIYGTPLAMALLNELSFSTIAQE